MNILALIFLLVLTAFVVSGESLNDTRENVPKRTIRFINTSPVGNDYKSGKNCLTSRHVCAIESAALMNPEMQIIISVAGDNGDKMPLNGWLSDADLEMLGPIQMKYENIEIDDELVIENVVRNSPLERWWNNSRQIFASSYYPQKHASDFLKLLFLWRDGGIYVDLDVIVKSSFENMTNFAGLQYDDRLGSGVLGIENKPGFGRELMGESLYLFERQFNNTSWSENGGKLITNAYIRLCYSANNMTSIHREGCQRFEVYPKSSFYPVPWEARNHLFKLQDRETHDSVLEKLTNSKAFQFWDRLTSSEPAAKGSNVLITLFAYHYCPVTFKKFWS